jgi:hypothetical protein
MKIKTSELQGVALDWAVAKCRGFFSTEGQDPEYWDSTSGVKHFLSMRAERVHWTCASTNRDEGYKIVEREGIHLLCNDDLTEWTASSPRKNMVGWRLLSWGPTPLVAAMRCYVASKLGNEVDIPDGLIQLGETK